MTGTTARRACVIAVAGMFLSFPVPASAQEEGIEPFTGGGIEFPGDIVPRGRAVSATGAMTWWLSDKWGIAGWYSAVAGRDGRWFDHLIRPSIRYRTPMYDGGLALRVGFSVVSWTDVYPDTRPGVDLRLLPDLLVDVFVGVPVSPSISVQAGGLCFYQGVSADGRHRVDLLNGGCRHPMANRLRGRFGTRRTSKPWRESPHPTGGAGSGSRIRSNPGGWIGPRRPVGEPRVTDRVQRAGRPRPPSRSGTGHVTGAETCVQGCLR